MLKKFDRLCESLIVESKPYAIEKDWQFVRIKTKEDIDRYCQYDIWSINPKNEKAIDLVKKFARVYVLENVKDGRKFLITFDTDYIAYDKDNTEYKGVEMEKVIPIDIMHYLIGLRCGLLPMIFGL